ncbi:MAG: hypothetical protein AAF298_15285 [Cyanobacteria bacterium P01_A01_bin.40]
MLEEFELFVEEAYRLTNKSFCKNYLNIDVGFSPNRELDTSPHIEQLESYVLHFRKFLQPNDRVYVYRINNLVRTYIKNSENEINNFNLEHWTIVFNTLKHLLNVQSLIGRFKIDMKLENYSDLSFSLLEIFKIKTYGDLSHLDRQKREIHLKLSSNKTIEALYRHEYYSLLSEGGELFLEMSELITTLI